MSKDFYKFPSINQYRHVCNSIRHKTQATMIRENEGANHKFEYDSKNLDLDKFNPTLNYKGYIKIDGTNCAIINTPDNSLLYQSRSRPISIKDDHYGFSYFCDIEVKYDDWIQFFGSVSVNIPEGYENGDIIAYGEWCGPKIQKGIGLSKLPEKAFIIFGIKVALSEEDYVWLDLEALKAIKPHARVHMITEFPSTEITIDFTTPQAVVGKLIEETNKVEADCPVAKQLGVEGSGEGLVWHCTNTDFQHHKYWFKVVGERHSRNRVKNIVQVDPEQVKNENEFVHLVITENRLMQGVHVLEEMGIPLEKKSTPHFLKWMYADVIKEEQDIIDVSEVDPKRIGKLINARSKEWWLKYLDYGESNVIEDSE
jgi:ferritin